MMQAALHNLFRLLVFMCLISFISDNVDLHLMFDPLPVVC